MQEQRFAGLSENEVITSRREHGSNRLTRQKKNSFLRQFLSNFGDPIIKVLLAALAINVVFLFRHHDWYESVGIAIAVFLATFVSTVSEYGSEAAFEKLQAESADIRCRVKRGGKTMALPIEELVVGDIVLLQSGERIPADGLLIDGALHVDQSALNGESREMEKNAGGESLELSASSSLLRGCVICSGEGVMRVSRVGDHTVYGSLAGEIQEETRQSPLKLRLEGLASTLSRLGFIAAGLVAFADLFHAFVMENHYQTAAILAALSDPAQLVGNLLHAATLALTVVVVAVPEGLPMMITVVLSSNMRRMLKSHVLVRKLVGIETSGSLNILFTDKTGTLTRGQPEVSVVADAEGHLFHAAEELHSRKTLWELLRLSGFYNTDSQPAGREILGGNATERALLRYVLGRQPLRTGYTVADKIPFDSERKWSGVEISGSLPTFGDATCERLSLYKGAPEHLLAVCDRYLGADGKVYPFTDRSNLTALATSLAQHAMRLIAIAVCERPLNERPSGLILVALAGLRDEVRPEVRRAVTSVHKAGIQVVMMTGDSKLTATAIARSAGLLTDADEDAVLTSGELAALDDTEVKRRLSRLRVIARALPSDKSRLIRLSQECGLVAGMTGDGVNDAPALKKADVGFAMGSGTEVAKQAGDIVILDDNFASIAQAILYGRTIFKSIRKFIIFQLTMNLCAVGVSVIGPLIGLETPVTVMQMLWINIIMDTLAGLAFAGEPPLPEYMEEPPKRRDEPVLNRYMLNQILCTGGFTVALCIAFLKWEPFRAYFRYDVLPVYWMTAFFALFIFCGIFNCFNARTYRLNLLAHLHRNPAFVAILTLITAVQIGLIYYGGSLFRTAGLTLGELIRVLLLAALVIPFDLLRKAVLRLFHRKGTL